MKLFLDNTKNHNKSIMIDFDDIREFFNNKNWFVVIRKNGKIETFNKLEYSFTVYNRDFTEMP